MLSLLNIDYRSLHTLPCIAGGSLSYKEELDKALIYESSRISSGNILLCFLVSLFSF